MENEIKLLLDNADDLLRLLSELGAPRPTLHQFNLYFDSARGGWAHEGWAVRLRREDQVLWLTVKTAGVVEGDFVRRGEWERTLPIEDLERLAEGGAVLGIEVVRLLEEHDVALPESLAPEELFVVGTMENLRRRALLPGAPDHVVELDETTYPNGDVCYEAEMEVADPALARVAVEALRECFVRAGLGWKPSTESKRARLERVLSGGRA
jgi:uncharacterized protein YjbK